MIAIILAVAFASLIAQAQAASVQTYIFEGYVPCTSGQFGCNQWPQAPHPWVRFTFGNGLSAHECRVLEQQSVALTGVGFCEPPLP